MSKQHWSDRAKKGLRATTEFVADHGSDVGLAGAAVLGLMGAGSAAAQITATDPAQIELYREGAATFVLAAVLKMGGMSVAEQVAKTHLRGVDHLFGSEDANKQTRDVTGAQSSGLGAQPENTDDPTQGAEFKQAVKQLFNDLANEPDNRAEVISLLKRSPAARKALVEDQVFENSIQDAHSATSTDQPDDDADLTPTPGLS